MCFNKLNNFRVVKMTNRQQSVEIIQMMKDNNFYYRENSFNNWKNLDRGFSEKDTTEWHLYYWGNTLVGMTCVKTDTYDHHKTDGSEVPKYYWLLYLLIDKKYQQTGYGTDILDYWKQRTIEKDYPFMVLDLDDRKPMKHLKRYYQRKGFIGINNFQPDKYGQILMKWITPPKDIPIDVATNVAKIFGRMMGVSS